MPHISIVVPVYKAEDCLQELYRRVRTTVETITTDFELILVEDCGGDASWTRIEELAAADERVKGIQFSRNFGQHYGITAGMDHCDGDWVVVMDCDLQDRPEEILRLYAKAQEGYDVVLARRGIRSDPPMKRLTSWAFYRAFGYLADLPYDGEVGNFRIFSRTVAQSFVALREQLRFFGGLMQWLGFNTASIDVIHGDRFAGQTSYTWLKLWKLASETIIAYSDKPLRLVVRFGFFIAVLAFLFGLFVIYRSLAHGIAITGWASLIVSLYFIGGIIISTLGIIGIYLGKTFDETKRRPLYIVSRSTNLTVSSHIEKKGSP